MNKVAKDRLLKTAKVLSLLNRMKVMAKTTAKMPSELASDDVIVFKDKPMKVLKNFKTDLLVEIDGKQLNITLPDRPYIVISSGDDTIYETMPPDVKPSPFPRNIKTKRRDDESYPSPIEEEDNSRYKVEPKHDESSVDLIRFVASLDRIVSALNRVTNG